MAFAFLDIPSISRRTLSTLRTVIHFVNSTTQYERWRERESERLRLKVCCNRKLVSYSEHGNCRFGFCSLCLSFSLPHFDRSVTLSLSILLSFSFSHGLCSKIYSETIEFRSRLDKKKYKIKTSRQNQVEYNNVIYSQNSECILLSNSEQCKMLIT